MSPRLWDGTSRSCCGSRGARESSWAFFAWPIIEREISETERRLLEALAGHASVALENVRLFSRIERSRKQWVEDIDAISDFIVVHDKAGRVLRLNRVLADLLGTHPAESVGKDVGKLGFSIRRFNRGAALSAAGPRPPTRSSCTRPATARIWFPLRAFTAEEDEVRTIHVLKDITDRREAERRYRRERDFNRNILNNTQSMILVLDTAKLVSYANRRCFEAGYREQDLLGHPLVEMVCALATPHSRGGARAERFREARSIIWRSRRFAETAPPGNFRSA